MRITHVYTTSDHGYISTPVAIEAAALTTDISILNTSFCLKGLQLETAIALVLIWVAPA